MNRDQALFLVVGLLAGFLAGYVLQEEMAEIQPPRVAPGSGSAIASPATPIQAPTPQRAPAPPAAMAEIERLRQRVESNPNDAQALLELANLNFDIQNWGRARELYQRVATLRPGDPDVLTDLGICLRALGSFEEALTQFRVAQAASPRHWQARFNEIVVLALDLRDLPAAEARLAELTALAPDNPDVARLADEIRKRKSSS